MTEIKACIEQNAGSTEAGRIQVQRTVEQLLSSAGIRAQVQLLLCDSSGALKITSDAPDQTILPLVQACEDIEQASVNAPKDPHFGLQGVMSRSPYEQG
ncbi:MAG: hypothetical protein PHO20_04230 [Candidatus Peribacteraceae bacterium]|nr:hypothetical protein [Candidatus Peribacteraceae bacterium]MDD5739948.1 hypothetical protein [Candidatus Peribacteraceae bacterium]